jgi:predicted outer membrane repeat protein/parallel beta-helix repeat protein
MKYSNYKYGVLAITLLFIFFCLLTTCVAADYGDIRIGVSSAVSGGTVDLGSDTYYSDGSDVRIEGKNLTIRGTGDNNRATLNSRDVSGAFYVDSDSVVTFRYINFVNASFPRSHALTSNGTIFVYNCSFSSSNGDSGSAIYLNNGSTGSKILNSRFINNKGDNGEDNDYTTGGAVCITGTSDVEVSGCYFSGNSALNYGGALTIRGDASNIRIINSTFVNNRAPSGGAIYNQLASGTIISGCTFENNKATDNGGAIYAVSPLNIVGSTFKTNTVTNNGGAIYISGSGRSTISGSKFTNNSAKNGGAIYNNAQLSISSSDFKSNKASSYGGAIYAAKKFEHHWR